MNIKSNGDSRLTDASAQAENDQFDPNDGAVIVEEENQSSYMKGFPPPEDKLVDGYAGQWSLDPDKSLWALQNVSKILHTAVVSRGSAPIVYLPRNDKNYLDKGFKDNHGKTLPLKQILKAIKVDGFIALKDGKILVEAYYNGYRPEKQHQMFSVTKSLIGALIGILVGEGKLDTSQLIPYYLPELIDSGWGDATLQQTLDQTTGIHWTKGDDEKSHFMMYSIACGFASMQPNFPFKNGISMLKTLVKEREHGLACNYNSANSSVLGWLITRISDQHWQDVFSEKIWSKLGTEHDALIVVDSGGQGAGAVGFNATLRDMARFGVVMAQNGYYNGQQIVPRDWIDDIRYGNDDVRRAWKKGDSLELMEFGDSAFYHNQYRVLDSDKGIFIAQGAKGQMIYINISENLVGVFQSSTEAAMDMKISRQQISIIEQISM
jgi:CubicO group peptidase (beta-lactamase class C family)